MYGGTEVDRALCVITDTGPVIHRQTVNNRNLGLVKTKEIVLNALIPDFLFILPLLLTLSRFEQLNCLVLYCVTLCCLMNMFMPF